MELVEYSFLKTPRVSMRSTCGTDALTMADNVMTFRLIVREIALEQVHARLCRTTGVQGSGMYTYLRCFGMESMLLRSRKSDGYLKWQEVSLPLLHHARNHRCYESASQ